MRNNGRTLIVSKLRARNERILKSVARCVEVEKRRNYAGIQWPELLFLFSLLLFSLSLSLSLSISFSNSIRVRGAKTSDIKTAPSGLTAICFLSRRARPYQLYTNRKLKLCFLITCHANDDR